MKQHCRLVNYCPKCKRLRRFKTRIDGDPTCTHCGIPTKSKIAYWQAHATLVTEISLHGGRVG